MNEQVERLMLALIPLEAQQPWAVSKATGQIDIMGILKQAEVDAIAYLKSRHE
jgi:hypothetical protein